MKHRTRGSSDQRQRQPQQQRNGAVAITIASNGREGKVHGRPPRRGLKATIVLALLFAAVLAVPIVLYLKLQPLAFSSDNVNNSNERVLYNAQSGHAMRRSSAGSAAAARSRPRIAIDLKRGEQPPPIASRRRKLRNRSSTMMTDDFREQLEDSHDYDKKSRDPLYEGDCVPMRKWQEQLFPNCNSFHELDVSTVHSSWLVVEDGKFEGRIAKRFGKINSGGYNDVFRFHLDPPTEEDIVLKALNYGTEFTDRNFDRVRRDALIAERGTFSKYMVDINGHCGLSLLTPYGADGTLSHYTSSKADPVEKLRMARHAAFGIADAHNLDHDGVSSITQGDLKLDQYLYVDGYFKLGDFNRGRFCELPWYKICSFCLFRWTRMHVIGLFHSNKLISANFAFPPQLRNIIMSVRSAQE